VYSTATSDPYWVGAVPIDRYEVVPPSPYVGGVWIGGAWIDEGGHRGWRPGRWAPPHDGYHRAPRYRDGRGHDPRSYPDPRGYHDPRATPPVDRPTRRAVRSSRRATSRRGAVTPPQGNRWQRPSG
jgi:hypothetical protein